MRLARDAAEASKDFQKIAKQWIHMDALYVSMIEISVEGLEKAFEDPFHAMLFVNDNMLKLVSENQLKGPDPISLPKLKVFQGLVSHMSACFANWNPVSIGSLLENTLIVFQFAMSKAVLADANVRSVYDKLHQQLLDAVSAFRRE